MLTVAEWLLPSPSRLMPRARHFCSLQCWQRLRLVRSIRQFLCLEQEYIALFCWLRRKKPCRQKHKCVSQNEHSQIFSSKPRRRLTLQPSQVMTP